MDFFIVPTAELKVLFVLIILGHDLRRVLHFNVTEHPTAEWTAQQLVEAFLFESAPRYVLRDGDVIYGEKVRRKLRALGIEEVVTALSKRPGLRLSRLSGEFVGERHAQSQTWSVSRYTQSHPGMTRVDPLQSFAKPLR